MDVRSSEEMYLIMLYLGTFLIIIYDTDNEWTTESTDNEIRS